MQGVDKHAAKKDDNSAISGFLTVALSDARANTHGYLRRLGKTIFSAHFTTFSARATACPYSFLVTGSAGPGYRVSTAYVVKLSAFQRS
jgi:hypothetical protein